MTDDELRAAAPELVAEVLRLRRVLAVECGDESEAPDGWVTSHPGSWGYAQGPVVGRVTRMQSGAGWAWSWNELRSRQDGWRLAKSAVVASGQAPTALEAMEAADAAVQRP